MTENYVQTARNILKRKIDVEDDLLDLYTLLVLSRGTTTQKCDVHDAWAVWRTKTNPEHKSLIPFEELTPEVQELDEEYAEAIRKTAMDPIYTGDYCNNGGCDLFQILMAIP